MTRVLVVDPVRLTATVISNVLNRDPDLIVVGQASSVDEVMRQVESCDVVVVNSLNGNGTVDLTRAVGRTAPLTKVVVMGLPADKEIILQHIEAGVAGYVLRDESVDQLVRAVSAAQRGEAMVTPDVAAALMSRITQLANACQDSWAEPAQFDELTPREREVLALVRQGFSNQEIAQALTIELGTVKNHIHNILRKLNVRSRHDAASYLLIARDQDPVGGGEILPLSLGEL